MRNVFSADELSALESLEIRGGAIGMPDSPNGQMQCVNSSAYCGANVDQMKCTNSVKLCGAIPPPDPGTNPLITAGVCF